MNRQVLNIVIPALLLWFIGLVTIQSTMPSLTQYQFLYGVVGIVGAIAIASLNPEQYFRLPTLWYASSVIGLLVTEIFGVVSRGSTRWLTILGFRFQTSEFVKVAMVLFAAYYLAHHPLHTIRQTLKFAVLMLVPIVLIFIEPDLGTALMVSIIAATSVITSGLSIKKILPIILVGFAILPVGLTLLQPYQKERLSTFFNPAEDPLGRGYNVQQATIAVGSGMLWGRGLGQGTQSHLKFLPERHTDFIFASFTEEFGLIGAVIMLVLYAWLGLTALQVAKSARSQAQTYAAVSIAMLIFIQATVNIGMNLGILPVTGITLPLISYGGSSLLSMFILIGVLISCAKSGAYHQIELRLQ